MNFNEIFGLWAHKLLVKQIPAWGMVVNVTWVTSHGRIEAFYFQLMMYTS